MRNDDFQSWAHAHLVRIESALDRILPESTVRPSRLHEAMRYAVLGGGKRVRPLFSLASGELGEADMEKNMQAACSVELIHAYSLVHDDLPAMDDDVLRRGKPTCHVEYDEATALLVGDSLQSLAFETLASPALSGNRQVEMMRLLAQASGSRGMAGGQAMDLENVGKSLDFPELEAMHIRKTGELIRASILIGAHCAEMEEDGFEKLDHYAKSIGLAFQVIDDVLDAESSTATLGKTAGKDEKNGKPTYVSLMGVRQARKMADDLYDSAISAIGSFGEKAERLRQMAEFVVQRQF
ncbi:MAG TPA: polyprenyl synthetase family protein, partial [Burkholderiales bacterium]|nr:polyprenyl synthetase family protein [Burkholderiales bacterium]